jgi:hypothetical protein
MRVLAALCLALATLPGVASTAFAQACNVAKSLDWCAQDHGFNEDAACGLRKLGQAGLGRLPATASQEDPGKTWDRATMMRAAKDVANSGRDHTAVSTALCCQSNKPEVQTCLRNNRAEVAKWLKR